MPLHAKETSFVLWREILFLTPTRKRASARQRLIHGANIAGSLNGTTLATGILVGLHNRNIKHDKAGVSCNDGCYTNGAAHDKLTKATTIAKTILKKNNASANQQSKVVHRFISLCISHCLSNTGNQAGFVVLNLFWTTLQKVFSHLDNAKVRTMFWPDDTQPYYSHLLSCF